MQFNVEFKRSLNVQSTTCSSLFMKNSSFIIYEKKGLILVSSPLYKHNKRPMDYIAHLRNQTFKQSHDFIYHEIGLVVKKILKFCQCIFPLSLLSPLGNKHSPSFEQTGISFTQRCFVPSLVEIGPVVLEKKIKILNFVNVFSQFRNYPPLEKDGVLHLNKLESPSPKDDLCQVWFKLAKWFWWRRF